MLSVDYLILQVTRKQGIESIHTKYCLLSTTNNV